MDITPEHSQVISKHGRDAIVAQAQPVEAEQPEVVATLEPYTYDDPEGVCYVELRKNLTNQDAIEGDDRLMMVSQHRRIVGTLRAANAKLEKELAMARDAASKGDAARHAAGGMEMEIRELREKAAELQKELRSRWTYASTQATNCAGCGEHKHTPLRVDWMSGYVCLTCIKRKLEALRSRAVVIPDAKAARVILDDGSAGGLFSSVEAAEEWASIWNSDSRNTARVYPMVRVDELAHLNGLTVSEELLRTACFDGEQAAAKAMNALRAMLSSGEED
ncbi:hypothetical protein M003_18005 [Pseudomonas aeruginosa IGB83]|nr:hypothetical protein M003_18005 [Pseudomonas aeruginosa IGB83]